MEMGGGGTELSGSAYGPADLSSLERRRGGTLMHGSR
jgi:hypothetical protein